MERTAEVGANDDWDLSAVKVLADLARDPFIEIDASGSVTEWNRQAELYFGWPRDEAVGRQPLDFLVPARHAERFNADLCRATVMAGTLRTDPRQIDLLHRDGHEVHMTATLYVVERGGDLRIGGFLAESDAGADETVAHMYLHDGLTGLANRTLFTYRLAYALAQGTESQGVAVVVLDLDGFRAINDGLGHDAGDDALVEVATRLEAAAHAADIVARLGGDEFLVLFHGPDAAGDASDFADAALAALADPIVVEDNEVFIGSSIGIAVAAPGHAEAAALLSNADAAMYHAKRRGGRRVEVFGEQLRMRVVERLTTEHALHRAVERQELRLYYQPVVSLADGEAVATEALVRWHHPQHGMLGPERFIPVAEETGLVIPIGAWVLRQACHQLQGWRSLRAKGPFGAVEVNLAAAQVDSPDIVGEVERALADSGLPPEHLTLEITESALMHDPAAALRVLSDLRQLGVSLAVDDFGTGYSSLAYLQRFPLDILKIDRSFVAELGLDPGAEQIVAAVVGLAHALGIKVVAEGVESERQADELRRLKCDFAQGFLYGRPAPAAAHTPAYGLARPVDGPRRPGSVGAAAG
ncbi:MAG: putative bifunctional diguanylate cyclase/phosphodiesterase [Acidimicrobiales bacterium]